VNKLKLKHIAWFIPVGYLLHLLDEYFVGEGFANWFSEVMKANLSSGDFIIINSFGLAAVVLIVMLYSLDKLNGFLIAALGVLFFVNGIVHITASLLTVSYSPGTFTSFVIYLPLGFVVIKNFYPLLPEQQRILSIITGVALQVIVAIVALNI